MALTASNQHQVPPIKQEVQTGKPATVLPLHLTVMHLIVQYLTEYHLTVQHQTALHLAILHLIMQHLPGHICRNLIVNNQLGQIQLYKGIITLELLNPTI